MDLPFEPGTPFVKPRDELLMVNRGRRLAVITAGRQVGAFLLRSVGRRHRAFPSKPGSQVPPVRRNDLPKVTKIWAPGQKKQGAAFSPVEYAYPNFSKQRPKERIQDVHEATQPKGLSDKPGATGDEQDDAPKANAEKQTKRAMDAPPDKRAMKPVANGAKRKEERKKPRRHDS